MKNFDELEREAYANGNTDLANAYAEIMLLRDGIQDALSLIDGGDATEEQIQGVRDLLDRPG